MPAPRIAAIHDLSCFGRCSLTIALPVLSAMGCQCCPLPTALLSAHTGISGFTFLDTTDEMRRISAHWSQLSLHFQAIYTGFLGSAPQINLVEDFLRRFHAPDTLLVMDPVMGDTAHRTKPVRPRCARVFGSWWRRPMSSRQISQRPLFYWTFPTMNPKPPMPRSWCGH